MSLGSIVFFTVIFLLANRTVKHSSGVVFLGFLYELNQSVYAIGMLVSSVYVLYTAIYVCLLNPVLFSFLFSCA